MLTAKQTATLKEMLDRELHRLAGKAHDALDFSMNRDRASVGRDSIDESMEEEIYATQLRLHDRETGLIAKVQSARARLEQGKIDECEDCQGAIGFRRLEARPVTTLCVECKTIREREEDEIADEPDVGRSLDT